MIHLFNNLPWMLFNLILALVPVALTILLRDKYNRYLYLFILFIWLLFLPNSIYLISDLQYLPQQILDSRLLEQLLLLGQFTALAATGVVAYLYSLEPFYNILKACKLKEKERRFVIFIFNFIIAFGVILGKTQRTHSWYVFTDPLRVVNDVLNVLTSSTLLVWVVIMGVIINTIYFLTIKYFKRHKNK